MTPNKKITQLEENKKLLDTLEGLEVEKVEHPNYKALKNYDIKPAVGQYAYIYENEKGKVHLVELRENPFGISIWETQYIIDEGKPAQKKKHNSKNEAILYIKNLLELN